MKSIIMSAASVLAVLNGAKSQTRRVITPQPEHLPVRDRHDVWLWRGGPALERASYGADYVHTNWDYVVRAMLAICPHGKVGDQLWVREALRDTDDGWVYAADGDPVLLPAGDPRIPEMLSWAHHTEREECSARHMPKFASRLTVQLTGVSVEWLQDITEDDARAEGMTTEAREGLLNGKPATLYPMSHRRAFIWHWDAINAKRKGCSWVANPAVYREAFSRVEAGKAAA